MPKHVIVSCGRKLPNGFAQAYVADEYIEASISMDLFMEMVIERIGSVATVFKQETFDKKFRAAVDEVLLEVAKTARPLSRYVK